jgi:dienelactone hydrolase
VLRRARSVLGDDGPAMADRVLASLTPGCPTFSSAAQAQAWSDRIRNQVLDSIGLDLRRRAVSAEIQKTIENPEYRIEVARIEVFPDVYMPANIYIPNLPAGAKTPLVITPIACNADSWSSRAQQRAANLARLGIVVVATDGFCGNGVRASLPDNNRHIGYARQLFGMRGISFAVYLQELISTITWAKEHYPFIDGERIGAVGSSYGGQVALMLAQLDTRIQSVSVAGTYLGEPCDGYPLKSDIYMENMRPPHVWLAPIEAPVLPVNWRLLTVFPRALHVTSGEADMSAPPFVIGGAMSYARSIYALGGIEARIAYETDAGKHSYNSRRRQSARTWMSRTLLEKSTPPGAEAPVPVRSWDLLAADISGTATLFDELRDRIDRENAERFGLPQEQIRANVREAMDALFPEPPWPLKSTTVFEHNRGGIAVRGYRMRAESFSFPVVIVESTNGRSRPGGTLLYLPRTGTQAELMTITSMLQHYHRVVSIDYLGIGELKSNRLRLHTLARYLMHNDPSLPKINISELRAWLATQDGEEPMDIWATSWPTSFYAAALKWLIPSRVARVYLQRVPQDELRSLQSRKKVPDLLLWAGLYDKISVHELSVAIGEDAKLVR